MHRFLSIAYIAVTLLGEEPIFDQESSIGKPEPQAGPHVETDIEFSYRLPADIFFPGGHLLSPWNWSPFRPPLTTGGRIVKIYIVRRGKDPTKPQPAIQVAADHITTRGLPLGRC
jgi:hypothetical protein